MTFSLNFLSGLIYWPEFRTCVGGCLSWRMAQQLKESVSKICVDVSVREEKIKLYYL